MPTPGIGMEVVHDVAAADQQDTFVAQRRQPFPEFMVESGGLCFVDTKLHHRYIGMRKDVAQHGPRAVIEPPGKVGAYFQRSDQRPQPTEERGFAGRGILHLEQLAREAKIGRASCRERVLMSWIDGAYTGIVTWDD